MNDPGEQRKLQIAYIIGTYPEISTTFIDREIRVLRELGLSIQILSIRHPADFPGLEKNYREIIDKVIYLIPTNWGKFITSHLYFLARQPITYLKTLAYLISRPQLRIQQRLMTLFHFGEGVFAAYSLRTETWDHIHAHFIDRAATVALCVHRFLKVPYSLTAHADDIYAYPLLVEEKINQAKFIVTVSEFNKRHLLEHYPSIDPDHIHVLHPWVDLNQFTSPSSRPEKVPLRILSVGRLVENKGHQYLIEACSHLQKSGLDFECYIVGGGPLEPVLGDLIQRYGLEKRVFLSGAQPITEVIHQMRQADIFVLASIVSSGGERDGMPVVLAEAMAMELPVVSTQLVGIPEMVRDGVGLVVPPNDAAALARGILEIWSAGVEGRSKMGRYGRKIITDEFNLIKGVTALAELFGKANEGA